MGNSSTGRYAEDAEAWRLPNRKRFADAVDTPVASSSPRPPGLLRRLAELLITKGREPAGTEAAVARIDTADAAIARAVGVAPQRVAEIEADVLRRVGLRRDELSVGEADRLRAVVLAESGSTTTSEVVRRAIRELARR